MVVAVRVRLAGAYQGGSQLVHTLDASEHGLKLAGFRGDLKVVT
jgi:hypothetical protein